MLLLLLLCCRYLQTCEIFLFDLLVTLLLHAGVISVSASAAPLSVFFFEDLFHTLSWKASDTVPLAERSSLPIDE